MDLTMIAVIVIAIIVISVIVYYYFYSTSSVAYTLTYEDEELSEGKTAPLFSSDGVDRIAFTKDSSNGNTPGVYMYNTSSAEKILISNKSIKGIAYDGSNFMMLDTDGTLHRINPDNTVEEMTNAGTGYTALYDTIDGFYLAVGSDYTVTGESKTTTKNTGNYGLISLVLKRSA